MCFASSAHVTVSGSQVIYTSCFMALFTVIFEAVKLSLLHHSSYINFYLNLKAIQVTHIENSSLITCFTISGTDISKSKQMVAARCKTQSVL